MRKPECYGIIPARFASSRLPGKPLADLDGKPMFWHVYNSAMRCPGLRQVWVATDDERVLHSAESMGVPCVMTRTDHPSGSDRIHEAAELLNLPGEAIIVNIQGDEPLLEPDMLCELLSPFQSQESAILASTLATVLDPDNRHDADLIQSPHQVKCVRDLAGNALYFSRSPIPFVRDATPGPDYLGHIGLYAYRRDVLARFTRLPQSPLEKLEKLEQLRLLENGIPLHVVITKHRPMGVDTFEDLEAARAVLSARSGRS